MNPTPQEAQAALSDIEAVVRSTRETLSHGVSAPLLMLWGAIWIVGYAISQFSPATASIAWPVLAGAGGVVSAILGKSYQGPTHERSAGKIGFVWFILFAFAALWIAFFLPVGVPEGVSNQEFSIAYHRKIGVFLATVPMFVYVVGGLWLGRFLTLLGLFVTAIITLSYFLVPEWCLLITGLVGGGSLMLSGVFIRKLWK